MKRALGVAVALAIVSAVFACGGATETKTDLQPPTDKVSKAPDAPVIDAGPDTGPQDSGGGDGAVCPPATVDATRFVAYHAPRAKSGMCTSEAMLESTVDDCIRGIGAMTCDQWLNDVTNLDCDECVITTASDAAWGPLVFIDSKRSFFNRGGAARLAGASDACAKAVHLVEACAQEACTCKVGSTVCDGKARTGPCKSYVTARDAACASASDQAALATVDPTQYAFYAAFCPP
jgi:hypothetical protein